MAHDFAVESQVSWTIAVEPVPVLVVETKLAFWGETETTQASSRLSFFRLAHSAQITSWKNWKGKQSKLMVTSSEVVCLCIGLTGMGSIIPVLGTSFVDIPLAYLLPYAGLIYSWSVLKTHPSLLKLHACMAPMTTILIMGWQHSYPTSSFFQLHVIRKGGKKQNETTDTVQSRKLSFSSHSSCTIAATSYP